MTRSLERRVARLERPGDPAPPAGTVWGPSLHAPPRSLAAERRGGPADLGAPPGTNDTRRP